MENAKCTLFRCTFSSERNKGCDWWFTGALMKGTLAECFDLVQERLVR